MSRGSPEVCKTELWPTIQLPAKGGGGVLSSPTEEDKLTRDPRPGKSTGASMAFGLPQFLALIARLVFGSIVMLVAVWHAVTRALPEMVQIDRPVFGIHKGVCNRLELLFVFF